jgi:DNA-binding transcriptional LysR family regulator
MSATCTRPAGGSIRITADEHALNSVLWPALRAFAPQYPDIKIEIVIDNGLTDIVAERFDAGVRLGGMVAKDMIAMRIGPDERMAVVATPSYLSRSAKLKKPQDLTEHACINFRLPTRGGIYPWEFEKKGREFRVRVDGQLIFNGVAPMLKAALDGFGIAYLPEDLVQPSIEKGKLLRLLADWTPPFAGYHLYYPSRRQPTAAFTVLLEALRYRDQN